MGLVVCLCVVCVCVLGVDWEEGGCNRCGRRPSAFGWLLLYVDRLCAKEGGWLIVDGDGG
jgi:hypothetical protein